MEVRSSPALILIKCFVVPEVEQFPVPKNVRAPVKPVPAVQKTPPTKQGGPSTATVPATSDPAPPASSAHPKKGKWEKTEKKKGGGEAVHSTSPVDVSRLDMRVGRIQKAWKHPDADGLYVEEGEGESIVK